MFRMSHASIVRCTTVVYIHSCFICGRQKFYYQVVWRFMAVQYSCAPEDGCMWHPKHVEQGAKFPVARSPLATNYFSSAISIWLLLWLPSNCSFQWMEWKLTFEFRCKILKMQHWQTVNSQPKKPVTPWSTTGKGNHEVNKGHVVTLEKKKNPEYRRLQTHLTRCFLFQFHIICLHYH
jgi:hypothetical protein